LVAAREQFGADLVSLVRTFQAPENGSCGVAWLLGAGQTPINGEDASLAFSVVSDSGGSQFPEDGVTCREEYLAHELGHNMGLQHDAATAQGTDDTNSDGSLLDPEEFGAYPYTFGYRTGSTAGNFYTIMAVRRAGQTGYRVFSNPRINSCGGFACGSSAADNAQGLAQTLPLVASFRATIVPQPVVSYPGSLIGIGGKCLDVPSGSTNNGAPIQVWACNGFRQQVWTPRSTTGALLSMGTNSALDVVGAGTANGTSLQLWSALGNANQAWYFAQAAIVADGGRVLDAAGASSANGTRMQLWDDLGGANQRWVFDISTGQIIGKDGKCLDVVGFGTANGTPVQFWTCSSTPNQQWSWGSGGTIRGYGGKCLEAANGGTGNGTQVRMWDCNGGAHQTWHVRGEVRSVMTGKCLDDPYSGTTNGTQVHMWECHGGPNQKWEYSSL
jgi:hypothetical protein